MKDRDAQLWYDNLQEPDPDERSWREVPDPKPQLEGPVLYDEVMEILAREKWARESVKGKKRGRK